MVWPVGRSNRIARAVADLGHLQVGVDLDGYAFELALGFELIKEVP
jgi:hypothetical protein